MSSTTQIIIKKITIQIRGNSKINIVLIYRFNQIYTFKDFFASEEFDKFRLPIISVEILLICLKSDST